MNKYLKFLTDPFFRFSILTSKGLYNNWSDEKFLRKKYKLFFKKELDLENPQTFTEKLQWLKIHDRNPQYPKMVDKVEAKKYVADIIGDEYIIPTIGVWDSVDDIDFSTLPEKYAMKSTHDSGSCCLCRNESFNLERAKDKIRKNLSRNYYWNTREWPYKNLKPRVIVEEYKNDGVNLWMECYKFFCFDGKVGVFYVASPKGTTSSYIDFYDADCNRIEDLTIDGFESSGKMREKDATMEKMLEIASKLSVGIPQVRVDLYNINGHIYFGELTLFHSSGLCNIEPKEWDYKLGEYIKLPR